MPFGWTAKTFVFSFWRCRKRDDNPLWEFQMVGEAGQFQSDRSSGLTLTCTQRVGGPSIG